MTIARETILRLFLDVLETTERTITAPLTDQTVLLESGMDSLGFAILVARLDEELGCDPFTASKDPYYPKTFGEFVAFYEKHLGP